MKSSSRTCSSKEEVELRLELRKKHLFSAAEIRACAFLDSETYKARGEWDFGQSPLLAFVPLLPCGTKVSVDFHKTEVTLGRQGKRG